MSARAKYTRGPWGRGEGLTVWARGIKLVAIVSRNLRRPAAEEEANATLIAAAPELAEALRPLALIAEHFDGTACEDGYKVHTLVGRTHTEHLTLGQCRAARAALVKAGAA